MLRREFLLDAGSLTLGARACYAALAEPACLPSDDLEQVLRETISPHFHWKLDAERALDQAMCAANHGWTNIGVWAGGGLVGVNPRTGLVEKLPESLRL